LNIAVIVAHPDDKVLAFGGIICRHTDAGDKVHVLFLATGISSRDEFDTTPAADAIANLREQAQLAGSVLGVENIEFAEFPDNRMDSVALLDVVKRVDRFIESVNPEIVYTHHVGDLNIDHAITARAVLTACRPIPGSRIRQILAGEILSSSEYAFAQDRFRPTTYVGIESFLDWKREALQAYGQEVRF
jgi:LmbE family N-acetylglucosaminyl deacetylase